MTTALERAEDGLEAPLRKILQRLRRRWLLVTTIFVIGTSAAVAFVQFATPTYTAQAVLAVGPPRNDMLDSDKSSSASDQPATISAVWTEVTKLQSWTLADQVIDRLSLMSDQEINASLRHSTGGGVLQSLKAAAPGWLRSLGVSGEVSAVADALRAFARKWTGKTQPNAEVMAARVVPDNVKMDPVRLRAIQAFQKHLDIQPDRLSNLINVRFTTYDPQRAAWIVNDFVRGYLDGQVAAKYRSTQDAVEWLTGTIKRMHEILANSENALETFRVSHQLSEGNGKSLLSQQLSEINREYADAQVAEALSRARARTIQDMEKNPGALAAGRDATSSPVIQQLNAERVRLGQGLASAMVSLGPQNPEVARLRRQLAQVDDTLAVEMRSIASGAEADVDAATARRESLAARLAEVRDEVNVLSQSEVRLRELQREADANRAVYEPFLLKVKDLTAKLEVQHPDATIVSLGQVPLVPSYPQKPKIVGLGALGSLILGVLAAFLVDMQNTGFDSIGHVERLTDLRGLGAVPRIDLRQDGSRIGFGGHRSGVIYAEAIQGIRSSMEDAFRPRNGRTLMITSAVVGEGKSTLAASLARMAAICGERVVLIDGDLVSPTLHSLMGVKNGTGLTDLLSGGAELRQALREDVATPMRYIVAGSPLNKPNDLLGSRAMKDLLGRLCEECDLVVVDTSPILAVSDPRRLARLVDHCLMVVAWRKTPVQVCLAAIRQIRNGRPNDCGMVLSRVDLGAYLESVTGGARETLKYFRGISARDREFT